MSEGRTRYTATRPCPICGGHDREDRGCGKRCYGYLPRSAEAAICTREEYAGRLQTYGDTNGYLHALVGDCDCGRRHDPRTPSANGHAANGRKPLIAATYPYRDSSGKVIFECVRFKPKAFRQRRPDGNGRHTWDLKGVQRVLYRLPELLAADAADDVVIVVEGEKDADCLARLGFVATTCPMGAGKWRDSYSEALRGRDVVVIGDNDDEGRGHVAAVCRSLQGKASRVRVVQLDGLVDHGDVSDWLDLGHTAEELRQRISSAAAWTAGSSEERGGSGVPSDADGERRGETQASRIVRLAEAWDLFHTAQGDAYATFVGDGEEQQTWPLRSRGAGVTRDRLEQLYYTTYGGVPGAQAVQDALGMLAGRARFAGTERPVFVRLAEHEDALYLDLCDRAWRVVEVTGRGWRVIPSSEAPVRFRRSRGMLALPEPHRGGSIGDLRPFVNVLRAQDGDSADGKAAWTLIVAWLLAALRPRGPYPILVCAGEQGTAKSTLQRVLRALVDPHRVALRRPPRDERDLAIAASNSWLVGLENVSALPDWLSDALCALSTGGGFGTRALYENDEEALFDAQRPVMINGIPVVVTRGDALDRSLILRLPEIADEARMAEEDFWRRFEQARPGILGALLDGVATALRRKAHVTLARLPRMADFALWVTAAEPGVGWSEGTFMAVYDAERAATHEVALQASPVAGPLWAFMRKQCEHRWSGTATELLDALNNATAEQTRKRKGWPALPHHLSGELSRLAPHLRALGLVVTMARNGRKRTVDLHLESKRRPASSASSASFHAQAGDADGPCGDADWAGGDADLPFGDADAEPIYGQNDADDAGDADLHQHSKQGSGVAEASGVELVTGAPCWGCHKTVYWLRGGEAGGGPVCATCHPPQQAVGHEPGAHQHQGGAP